MKMTLTSPSLETEAKPKHFFILTFILSWLVWIPPDFSHFGSGRLHIPVEISSLLVFLGVLMPASVALILTSRAGGKNAVRRLSKRLYIILGLCWASWNLPFWLLQDSIDQFGAVYLVMNFLLLPITIYIAWFFNHSKISILLPVVFHLTFNIVNTIMLPVTMNLGAFGIFIVLEWLLALLILSYLETGQRKLMISNAW